MRALWRLRAAVILVLHRVFFVVFSSTALGAQGHESTWSKLSRLRRTVIKLPRHFSSAHFVCRLCCAFCTTDDTKGPLSCAPRAYRHSEPRYSSKDSAPRSLRQVHILREKAAEVALDRELFSDPFLLTGFPGHVHGGSFHPGQDVCEHWQHVLDESN